MRRRAKCGFWVSVAARISDWLRIMAAPVRRRLRLDRWGSQRRHLQNAQGFNSNLTIWSMILESSDGGFTGGLNVGRTSC